MSLLINGMDMPKSCSDCPLIRFGIPDYFCVRTGTQNPRAGDTINSDCPLIEIPIPHGRLIDADELTRCIEHAYGDRNIVKLVTNNIARQQTIVEAEI